MEIWLKAERPCCPRDAHMILKPTAHLQAQLDTGELSTDRPAVDVLFHHCPIAFCRSRSDFNRNGEWWCQRNDRDAWSGALTLAQDQESCVVYGMPKVAVESGAVDESLTPEQIVKRLIGGVERFWFFGFIWNYPFLQNPWRWLLSADQQSRFFLRSHFNLLISGWAILVDPHLLWTCS